MTMPKPTMSMKTVRKMMKSGPRLESIEKGDQGIVTSDYSLITLFDALQARSALHHLPHRLHRHGGLWHCHSDFAALRRALSSFSGDDWLAHGNLLRDANHLY